MHACMHAYTHTDIHRGPHSIQNDISPVCLITTQSFLDCGDVISDYVCS